MDTNANNGLMTKIWGPFTWTTLHSITFGYPINPTEEQKQQYKQFLELVGDTLPCKYCRISYKEFITTGCTKLTYDTMKNRNTLTRWMYDIHECVNKKLGVDYGITYDDMVNKYESYRAKCSKDKMENGCVMPLDIKKNSYEVANRKDCPIISVDIAKKFINYAKRRKLDDVYFDYLQNFTNKTLMYELENKDSELWIDRNKKCTDQIENMRINGIESIEQDGQWKGLPTIDETKLILMLCTNLNIKKLLEVSELLPMNISTEKVYKLVQ